MSPDERDARGAGLADELAALDFLAGVFTELPTEELMEAVLSLDSSAIDGPVGYELTAWADSQRGRDVADVLLDVARDRVVLIRGVYEDGVKPPYESLWVGSDAPSSIAAVNRFCAEADLVPTGEVRDTSDQLGVELSLLSALARRELDALEAGDAAGADDACGLRDAFTRQHVGRWAGAYAATMRDAAATGFYRSIALMLEGMFPSHDDHRE